MKPKHTSSGDYQDRTTAITTSTARLSSLNTSRKEVSGGEEKQIDGEGRVSVFGASYLGSDEGAFALSSSHGGSGGVRPSEAQLVHDLLYVLQGVEGTYLSVQNDSVSYDLKKGVKVDLGTRQMLGRICVAGQLCRRVREYSERGEGGAVEASLRRGMQEELQAYYRMVAALEEQVVGGAVMSRGAGAKGSREEVTLMKLLVWTQGPTKRLQLLADVIADARYNRKAFSSSSSLSSFPLHLSSL